MTMPRWLGAWLGASQALSDPSWARFIATLQTVRSCLSSIDTPIPASRWRALGPRAETVLVAVVDAQALPTRRAKAIDGLAALGSARSVALFSSLAQDEAQPLNVRCAALRGLGRAAPQAQLAREAPVDKSRFDRARDGCLGRERENRPLLGRPTDANFFPSCEVLESFAPASSSPGKPSR